MEVWRATNAPAKTQLIFFLAILYDFTTKSINSQYFFYAANEERHQVDLYCDDKKKLELESKLSTVRANFEQALLENQNTTQTLTSLTSEFEEYDKLLFKNKSKRDSTQLQVYTNNKEIALVDENLSLCSKQTRDWEVSH